MLYRLAAGLSVAVGLSACSLLPSGAPTASEFTGRAKDPDFKLVNLDTQVAKILSAYRRPGLAASFSGHYRPTLMLHPGDTISITIYEVTPVPLFGTSGAAVLPQSTSQTPPSGGHIATIPTQVIDLDGTVPVPFGGHVKVAGLTPAEAGQAIAKALEGKATNPQAVVTLITSEVNSATVNGDVGRPGLVPLTVRGERVLDVIAAAGGAKYPSYDTDVELIRGGRVAKAILQQVVEDPRENVTLQPGDSLYVVHDPRSFAVMGSALKVAQYDFNTEKVTLAEAIARSGGLNDSIANVGDVYLLRYEPQDTMRRIVPIAEPYRLDPAAAVAKGATPVAYHLDLRQASGYFISQSVQMRDKDVVLITNAESVQLSKLLNILHTMSGILYDVHAAIGNSTTTATREDSSTTDQ